MNPIQWESRIQQLAINTNMPVRHNCILFKMLANKCEEKWKLLEGTLIEHNYLGYGEITKVCIGLRKRTIFIHIDFPCPPVNWKPGKAVFTPQEFATGAELVNLAIPSQLAADIEELWKAIEWKQIIDQYTKFCTEATEKITVTFKLPELDIVDLKLICQWAKIQYPDDAPVDAIKLLLSKSESNKRNIERLISARLAERTVIKFYKQAGFQAKDISATQLINLQEGEWQRCDLQIDEYEIDVKNARANYISMKHNFSDTLIKSKDKKSYAEIRVQKPGKVNPISGSSVDIAGVLSPYFKLEHLLNHEQIPNNYRDREIIFLGTNYLKEWEKLIQEFSIPGALELDLHRPGLGSQRFLPKWMFDYPVNSYKVRNKLLKEIQNIPWPHEEAFWDLYSANLIPYFLSQGVDYANIWSQRQHSIEEEELVQKILSWRNHTQLSLPFLFLTILWHFVKMAQQKNVRWHPKMYRSMLFLPNIENQTEIQWPLFIYDPQETVYDLITALENLWQNHQMIVKEFCQYKLSGPGILRGRKPNRTQWETLVAHCGNCYHHPLIWGINEACQKCRKLICGCGFCSKSCSQLLHMSSTEVDFELLDEEIPF